MLCALAWYNLGVVLEDDKRRRPWLLRARRRRSGLADAH
jgi:hypothetical protein